MTHARQHVSKVGGIQSLQRWLPRHTSAERGGEGQPRVAAVGEGSSRSSTRGRWWTWKFEPVDGGGGGDPLRESLRDSLKDFLEDFLKGFDADRVGGCWQTSTVACLGRIWQQVALRGIAGVSNIFANLLSACPPRCRSCRRSCVGVGCSGSGVRGLGTAVGGIGRYRGGIRGYNLRDGVRHGGGDGRHQGGMRVYKTHPSTTTVTLSVFAHASSAPALRCQTCQWAWACVGASGSSGMASGMAASWLISICINYGVTLSFSNRYYINCSSLYVDVINHKCMNTVDIETMPILEILISLRGSFTRGFFVAPHDIF